MKDTSEKQRTPFVFSLKNKVRSKEPLIWTMKMTKKKFIKKRLQHGCFPVKLRTLILKNICEQLLFILITFNFTKDGPLTVGKTAVQNKFAE